MRKKKRQRQEESELVDDPRIGKRVFCVSLLPKIEVYGTILGITRFPSGEEAWEVKDDCGMMIFASATHFERYDYPTEFKTNDPVRYHLDEGGYWEAVVLHPLYSFNHLCFVIEVVNGQAFTAVRVQNGYTFAARPDRLEMI